MSLKFRLKKPEAAIWSIAITATLLAGPFSLAGVRASQVSPVSIQNAGFEDGTFSGWEKGQQTGNLGSSITQNGTGVTIFSGSRTFTHGARGAVGSPTTSDGSPNPYYAPAVSAGSWTFGPKNATYAAALQPKSEQTFAEAMAALGLTGSSQSAIEAQLISDRNASGFGSPNPTDAAWITREVELTADVTYTMSWNYVGTDYVPFNDGSVTSLVAVSTSSTPQIIVNNFTQDYAMLGFTNPGTGDYSTNSFGSTGWQTSTYKVNVTGTYKLGFAVFNLGDTGLSPVLMVDNATGTTDRCAQDGTGCVSFGGVEPNNETAPTVAPTTTVPETTTTNVPETTTTSTVPETTTTTAAPTTTTTAAPIPVYVAPAPQASTEEPAPSTTEATPSTTEPQVIAPLFPKPKTKTTTTTSSIPATTTTQVEVVSESTVPVAEEQEEEGPAETIPEENEEPFIVDDEEIIEEVEQLLESEVTSEVAEELVASEEVLAAISEDQAFELFSTIDESALTDESAAAIVVAVQNASEEIRKVFESAVDLFSGAFDDYKMVNQNISVGERRTLIAATVLMSTAAISISGPGSTPSSPSSSGPGARQNAYARKEDEEVEPAGEIAGDGLDWVRKIRIFNYENGVRTMNWKAFFTKFAYGIMNMGFTLAGSLVVYLTLSGPIQKIAGISTVLAIAAAMWLHMKEPESE